MFISLSAYTDPLSRNAKVMPFATAHISRDGKQISVKKLDDTTGFCNLDKGKVPVGSAEIIFPEPNLSVVRVDLKLGYTASVSDSVGLIIPIPALTTYTFTLTSQEKKI